MAKTPIFAEQPKQHPNLPDSQEGNERLLRQAEDENREFYELNQLLAGNVTNLQTGINEQILHALTRGRPAAPAGTNAAADRVKEERVQAELYRAVQGNETYETELGEDSRHYLGSVNVQHLQRNLQRRMGRQVVRVARGAAAMVGFNNLVEANLNNRFGPNRNLIARRAFVAQRLIPELAALPAGQQNAVRTQLGLPIATPVNNVAAAMGGATLSVLRNLRDFCMAPPAPLTPIPIYGNEAFLDLMLLVDLDQRVTSKVGLAEVYEEQTLRAFWNDLEFGAAASPQTQAMKNTVEASLEPNSLFPLKNSPDSTALMAELRARIHLYMTRPPAVLPPNLRDWACQQVDDEIQDIMANEVPEGQLTPEDNARIGTCRSEITPIITQAANGATGLGPLNANVTNLTTALAAARADVPVEEAAQVAATAARRAQIATELADLNTRLAARRAQVATDLTDLHSRLPAIDARINAAYAMLTTPGLNAVEYRAANEAYKLILLEKRSIIDRIAALEKEEPKSLTDRIAALENEDLKLQVDPVPSPRLTAARDLVNSLTTQLTQATTELQNAIDAVRTAGDRMATILRTGNALAFANDPANVALIAVAGRGNMNIFDLLADPTVPLADNIPGITAALGQLQNNVINRLEVLARPRIRLTPFQLLQRLMRRDYARENELDVSEYNEEANQYAALKAAMRVEDVKSVDRMRSANDRAAEYMRRGLARRGWDRLKKVVSKSQDIVGLEAIDFTNMTADKLLKQVINSSPDFAVFRGVDKFTTTRDLRHILNKKGQKVPREVIERFTRILEEALSRYKMVVPDLDKGVNSEDWDLEILIEPLKKLKLEMWAEDLVAQANASNTPNREQGLVALLRGCREREEQIEDEIVEEVKHPDAAWRVQLVKKNLKRILNREAMEGLNKIKQEGIEEKKKRIAQLETQLAANPEGSRARVKIQQDIDNLRSAINVAEGQIAQAADLHDRVNKAREYIRNNKLSRREKREYLESVGLTQVFDKMSQNFRMENAWNATKKASKTAAKAFWNGSSKAWKWSRKKFLNAATAKSIGSKTFSIGRLAATPITAPLGWAWKAGTFPFRLTGRAMSRSVDAPWWLAGQVNKTSLRRFYRTRVIDETSRMEKLVTRRNKLIKSLESAPYSWDKKRIADRMNRLEERIYAINTTANEVRKTALENKVDLGEMAVYSEVANDNGEIVIKNAA